MAIKQDGRRAAEMKSRIAQAQSLAMEQIAMLRYKYELLRSEETPHKCTCVSSVALYGCDAWKLLNKAERQILETIPEMCGVREAWRESIAQNAESTKAY